MSPRSKTTHVFRTLKRGTNPAEKSRSRTCLIYTVAGKTCWKSVVVTAAKTFVKIFFRVYKQKNFENQSIR